MDGFETQLKVRSLRERESAVRRAFCVSLAICASVLGQTALPSREQIDKHIDPSVEIYGKFAAVKLPIQNGTPIWNPGSIRVSPAGEIFVANYTGEIYRIVDSDQDGLEDSAVLFCNVTQAGLRSPTALAFHERELFVGTAQEIRAYLDENGDGKADRDRTVLKLPCTSDPQDWTLALCVGPDGFLYANISTDSYNPSPAPDPQGWRGSLLRVSRDGGTVEKFASGLRFAPGLAFDGKGQLFFSDNEGGGNPSEELNLATRGGFYGHNPAKHSHNGPGTVPIAQLSTARGVCGMNFNTRTNEFGPDLYVAFWGIGGMGGDGAIARVTLWADADGSVRAREKAFARLPKAYDLTFGPSGDLYVTQLGVTPAPMTPSEAPTGAIYRIIPAPWISPSHSQPPSVPPIRGNAARGKILFAERCAQCHATDGDTDLLGPNLAHLGALMDYTAARRAIDEPSHSIRSGYEGDIFETNDGELITGRIITSNTEEVTLMIPGNQIVTLQRSNIRTHRRSNTSLMPEKLLAGLDRDGVHDLFAFLEVREQRFRVRWRHRLLAFAATAAAVVLMTWCLKTAVTNRGS
jgi:putative heme-binding domain-containing protein